MCTRANDRSQELICLMPSDNGCVDFIAPKSVNYSKFLHQIRTYKTKGDLWKLGHACAGPAATFPRHSWGNTSVLHIPQEWLSPHVLLGKRSNLVCSCREKLFCLSFSVWPFDINSWQISTSLHFLSALYMPFVISFVYDNSKSLLLYTFLIKKKPKYLKAKADITFPMEYATFDSPDLW